MNRITMLILLGILSNAPYALPMDADASIFFEDRHDQKQQEELPLFIKNDTAWKLVIEYSVEMTKEEVLDNSTLADDEEEGFETKIWKEDGLKRVIVPGETMMIPSNLDAQTTVIVTQIKFSTYGKWLENAPLDPINISKEELEACRSKERCTKIRIFQPNIQGWTGLLTAGATMVKSASWDYADFIDVAEYCGNKADEKANAWRPFEKEIHVTFLDQERANLIRFTDNPCDAFPGVRDLRRVDPVAKFPDHYVLGLPELIEEYKREEKPMTAESIWLSLALAYKSHTDVWDHASKSYPQGSAEANYIDGVLGELQTARSHITGVLEKIIPKT